MKYFVSALILLGLSDIATANPMTKQLQDILDSGAGYRILDHYGEAEAKAIISAAFMEMRNHLPTEEEAQYWQKWLQETRSNADANRTSLMLSPEFQTDNQAWRATQLQACRVQLFMEQLFHVFDKRKPISWLEAHDLHQSLFLRYEQ